MSDITRHHRPLHPGAGPEGSSPPGPKRHRPTWGPTFFVLIVSVLVALLVGFGLCRLAYGQTVITPRTLSLPITVANGGTGATTLSGLVLGNGASAMTAYGGSSCAAGQFVSAISASGVATCSTPAGVPADLILVVDTATCPSGYTEVTAARGRHLVGMPSAGTILGTVGSAMTDQQNLSVTPTFTGSAVNSGGPDQTSNSYANTGAFDGSRSVHIHSVTAAGTVSAVTGGAVAPYLQILLCKKT